MKTIYLLLLYTVVTACTQDTVVEVSNETTTQRGNAAIIRLPVPTRAAPTDTNLVARLQIEQSEYNFGTVSSGRTVRHTFRFVNEGLVPLLITNARSTCGCTVADYPKEPIPPGEGGRINVVFDTAGKLGRQRKPIMLTANTYPATSTLYLSGQVTE